MKYVSYGKKKLLLHAEQIYLADPLPPELAPIPKPVDARRLIRSSQLPLMLTGYGTFTCQTKFPTCPVNTGKDSFKVYTSLPLSTVTY